MHGNRKRWEHAPGMRGRQRLSRMVRLYRAWSTVGRDEIVMEFLLRSPRPRCNISSGMERSGHFLLGEFPLILKVMPCSSPFYRPFSRWGWWRWGQCPMYSRKKAVAVVMAEAAAVGVAHR